MLNPIKFSAKNRLVEGLNRLGKKQRDILNKNDAPFTFPGYASDPASPLENQYWVNTTTHTAKIRINGATKTFTLT